ncbi:cupin domain-containing protein [Caenimonas aquaedulcis]|uniref:Cupin domain-containing protein n=1 Tax=Caenimonas aquaedulcis TaxID=2793270 RepID=A0A931H0Q9_9BURK|nr:cupin domain-containing protein [Caenimonas aquaedulcis]MBG9386393.1 cupin domain-containing protein [Caenimonas aquaedulcis]
MSDTATATAQQAAPIAQPFRFDSPEMPEGKHVGKFVVRLARTDRMIANVQVLKNGGETNLHTHHHLDGFWMVLKGHARFYGEGDVVVADLKEREGVLIPRHFKYWFESVGDDVLEILQVECADFSMPAGKPLEREDFTPLTNATRNITIIEGRVNEPAYGQRHKLNMG